MRRGAMMSSGIDDESTTLLLTPRRRQQLRIAAAGLCVLFTIAGIVAGMALVRILGA